MMSDNQPPQTAADEAAIAARVEAADDPIDFEAIFFGTSEQNKANAHFLSHSMADIRALLALVADWRARALAAEAALKLHEKALTYIANAEGAAPDTDTNAVEAGKEYRSLFWDVVEMAKVALAASADGNGGGAT